MVSSCASAGATLISLMPGIINDPANRTLRRQLLNFGSNQFCTELQQKGIPLKLGADQPVIGRYFFKSCAFNELENGDVLIQFQGNGYGWLQPTGRIGFDASGSVQLNPDFLLDGSTMYAYFRTRGAPNTTFTTRMIEREQQAGVLGIVLGGAVNDMANRLGTQVLTQELSQGFTVIRDGNGGTDFGLGLIDKGKRPTHPFQVHGTDKITVYNDRSEIQLEQRDFLGPIEISESGRALFFNMQLDGTSAIDMFLVHREDGQAWLHDYISTAGPVPPKIHPMGSDILPRGVPWSRMVPLDKGSYYIVLDNSSTAGASAPVGAAEVAYLLQIGDAP